MRAPDFWWRDGFRPRLLDPIGRLYGLAGNLRRHVVRPQKAGIPVICIGNLTAGGAGKTPTAIHVAERLLAMGQTPHLLTRGYGGKEKGPLLVDASDHDAGRVGDEPLLLSRVAPTWVSSDRVAGAAAALSAGASQIVMDDGLQNPYLQKDIRLLVIDGAVGFGNGRLIPAGPLREAVQPAASTIDAAVVIGEDMAGIEATLPDDLLCFAADLQPDGDGSEFKGCRAFAFAGIGRPEKFYETLRRLGAEIVETRSFPDHYAYKPVDIERILEQARQFDAVPVTTVKDHVRLPPILGKYVKKLSVRLQIHQPENLDKLLFSTLPSHAASAK